jgi:hypothetical protein
VGGVWGVRFPIVENSSHPLPTPDSWQHGYAKARVSIKNDADIIRKNQDRMEKLRREKEAKIKSENEDEMFSHALAVASVMRSIRNGYH